MTASNSVDNGDLIIEEDAPGSGPPAAMELTPWRVLIVDDDVDVHVVTKFALSHATFQNRRLSFMHAYTGAEAISILRNTPDIALVLLDVIMETDDAGLRVARQIREELHNELVRVVLRTGQPGQALEHSIIVDYDINDFWCKADLTTRKLFTTVITSLRAYGGMVAAARVHETLNAELMHAKNMQAALDQHAMVLTVNEHGIIVNVNDRICQVFQLGREALLEHDLHALYPGPFPQPLAGELIQSLAERGKWAGDIAHVGPDGKPQMLRTTIAALNDSTGHTYQYVAMATLLVQT